MAYLFDDFKNIKTFPAQARVYRDGVFVPELSEDSGDSSLPLHIIHIGKITGTHNWFVDANENRNVFLTARIETSSETKINIEINANLEGIGIEAKIFIVNSGKLNIEVTGNNNRSRTKINAQTKLMALNDSENVLVGLANIPSDTKDCESDIGFSALCEPNVKTLKISPVQRISSIPITAKHNASLYKPSVAQVKYLETAGLTGLSATELLNNVWFELGD